MMNKDKVFTWIVVAALFGGAAKMVKELQEHGKRKEIVGEVEVIDE